MLLDLDFKKRNMTLLGLGLTGFITSFIFYNNPMMLALSWIVIPYLLSGNRPTYVYAIVATLPRDAIAAARFLKFNIMLAYWERQGMTVPKLFHKVVQTCPKKIAIMMEDFSLTFQEADEFSNRVATYFKSKGIQRGDTVAFFMESRPEYPFFWLGLSKIGAITALINSNLRKETLQHSIKIAESKAIIVGSELASALNEVRSLEGVKNVPIYQYSDRKQNQDQYVSILEGVPNLSAELEKVIPVDLESEISQGKPKDKLVYIYTSGTTGMPKAAVITHLRYQFMCMGTNLMLGIQQEDIIYNPLPLYHTAGGMVGVGNVLLKGVSMAIRRKFSASNFWTDCIKYKCTVAQYIGELCRYILSVPSKPTDTEHSVRMMFGNGLRPQIWPQFVSRFNISQIGELYGSTEGNSNLVNFDNQVGAIGFVPIAAGFLYSVTLIKCYEETGEPIRNSDGRCIKCQPGEPGIFIGKINYKRAHSAFHGYADQKASEKKILRNVFCEGDMYFNSGDILVRDILGYFYFKDRTGDTFRWRGENVATSEVEAVISNGIGLKDCVVYGVEIPHVEGKAGMAAIVDPDSKVDMEQLSVCIRGSLPPYAIPLFIRLLPQLPITGTFKLKKRDLQSEGFDIKKIKDPIYFLNSDGIYRPFTEKDNDDILNGRARL